LASENRREAVDEHSGKERAADVSAGISSPGSEILLSVQGAAAVVTLNRPRALNAITTAMRAPLVESFPRWARDPQVYAVVIESACERVFSAGGDVLEMAEWGRIRRAEARRSLAHEYAFNWLLECFCKPIVSLIDGLVVGSGVGLTLYGTHRVAGERYRLAMPETSIGLFPDDGVCWAFARMPDGIGMYLALTGRAIGRADAYRLGLATHCVPAARFGAIKAALAAADPVDPVLDGAHEDPGAGELEPLREAIARCFTAATVEDMVARLKTERGSAQQWAQETAKALMACSPTALKVTHRHVLLARESDLRATLERDFRLACRFLEAQDFYEGVRARLIDRDQAPRWRPERLEDVTEQAVDSYFAPLAAEDELQLASRAEMQGFKPQRATTDHFSERR
jgi:enoyl-CoA hydratase